MIEHLYLSWIRLRALLGKEFLQLLRDPRMRFTSRPHLPANYAPELETLAYQMTGLRRASRAPLSFAWSVFSPDAGSTAQATSAAKAAQRTGVRKPRVAVDSARRQSHGMSAP